jgi:hypothetical protein
VNALVQRDNAKVKKEFSSKISLVSVVVKREIRKQTINSQLKFQNRIGKSRQQDMVKLKVKRSMGINFIGVQSAAVDLQHMEPLNIKKESKLKEEVAETNIQENN